MLSVGLMSGTSMDGIDAALIETDGNGIIKEILHQSISYKPQFKLLLKSAEFVVRKYKGDLASAKNYYFQGLVDYLKNELNLSEKNTGDKITDLSNYIYGINNSAKPINLDEIIRHSTQLHILAVKQLLTESGYATKQIDVIGYHGQTLFHRPSIGISVQVGDGQSLADALSITVVNNFRRADIAVGGQGAPFAPLYHQALAVRDKKIPVAVVNCGGIANITIINSADELDLIGFDTGPGNSLIDRLIRQVTQGSENMDMNGKYGKQGKVDKQILQLLYEKSLIKDGNNYFKTKPPKSLDYNDMQLIPELMQLSLADACRNLEAFTADSIINSVELLSVKIPQHWILTGGGWKNPIIRHELEQGLRQKLGSDVQIQTADEAGWNSQAIEAQTFAYLAVRSLQNQPISVPGTTRVPKPLSGGHAFLPKEGPTEKVKELVQANPAVLRGDEC